MEIWITADTHFNHNNIIEYCNRPFNNIKEMNETIISNWNSVVKKDDIVFHLGDFGFGTECMLNKIFVKLNGKINLILGNHDRLNKQTYRQLGFISVKNNHLLLLNDVKILLQHFPKRYGENQFIDILYLCGHTHGKGINKINQKDIGVDTNNFYPYNMNDLIFNYKKNGFSII